MNLAIALLIFMAAVSLYRASGSGALLGREVKLRYGARAAVLTEWCIEFFSRMSPCHVFEKTQDVLISSKVLRADDHRHWWMHIVFPTCSSFTAVSEGHRMM